LVRATKWIRVWSILKTTINTPAECCFEKKWVLPTFFSSNLKGSQDYHPPRCVILLTKVSNCRNFLPELPQLKFQDCSAQKQCWIFKFCNLYYSIKKICVPSMWRATSILKYFTFNPPPKKLLKFFNSSKSPFSDERITLFLQKQGTQKKNVSFPRNKILILLLLAVRENSSLSKPCKPKILCRAFSIIFDFVCWSNPAQTDYNKPETFQTFQ